LIRREKNANLRGRASSACRIKAANEGWAKRFGLGRAVEEYRIRRQ